MSLNETGAHNIEQNATRQKTRVNISAVSDEGTESFVLQQTLIYLLTAMLLVTKVVLCLANTLPPDFSIQYRFVLFGNCLF